MEHFWATSEALWVTYGAPLGDLWGTFEGHLRHVVGPVGTLGGHLRHIVEHMGHLLATSETLWGTYEAPLGDI